MALGSERLAPEALTRGQRREAGVVAQPGLVALVLAIVVDLQIARHRNDRSGRCHHSRGADSYGCCLSHRRGCDGPRGGLDPHSCRGPGGIDHLRGDRALPDQLVESQLVGRQLPCDRRRLAEAVARRTDRLVRLLGILDLVAVGTRRGGNRGCSVQRRRLLPRGPDRSVRERRRVRAHVGDEPALVQGLGQTHRPLGGVTQLASSLLLQGRGHERCGRRTPVGPLFDGYDLVRRLRQRGLQAAGGGLAEQDNPVSRQEPPVRAEIVSCRNRATAELHEARAEALARGRVCLYGIGADE